ncbi:MAG: M14 metallopeptidase family protein [Longimicrobiales bacterium]
MSARIFRNLALSAFAFVLPTSLQAQAVTTPLKEFGHEIGADYTLPNYTQFSAYFEKLARESDRMMLDTIGRTAEGRQQIMAIVTAPQNFAKLDHYRDIARRLASAEGLSDAEAKALAAEGKAVVWIDGGLHASEVLGAQQLIETVYQLVSRNDAETMRILNDVIILAVHANPDGMELISNWYMRNPDPTKRSTSGVPVLYQKYAGHDNNRDFYASTQPESENMNRVMYTEWFPQIMYNHHQTGPAGTVMFSPPFRDPFNYNLDAMIPVGIDLVGAAMHDRFLQEGKPGVTWRSGSSYSAWWNGGLRTMAYFHNMIGLLTETIGNPTPTEIPFVVSQQLPRGDLPAPIEPQVWHFRQSIDYSITANWAVMDIASRRREQFLYNIYVMGRHAIERGNRDSWTVHPRLIAAAQEALRPPAAANAPAADSAAAPPPSDEAGAGAGGGGRAGAGGGGGRAGRATRADFDRLLRAPEMRDPRGYIIPANQKDFLTATKFIDALLETGITVHRATRDFTVNGKPYAAGSFVVKTAQAFSPHVLDMFEPQDHPDDIAYPGAAPTAPYDNAGWTLAYQMGVQFDRLLEGFDGPFEKVVGLKAPRPAGKVVSKTKGYLLSHDVNDAFIAVNRLMAAKQPVYWLKQPFRSKARVYPAGTFYIPSNAQSLPIIESVAKETGLVFEGTTGKPAGEQYKLHPVRIALADRFGGSMPSGWTRWVLEQFDFPYELVFPKALDAGNLRDKYDVIIFPDGGIPASDGRAGGAGGGGGGNANANIPEEFVARQGNITIAQTIPQLKTFIESGGTVITVGTATVLGRHLGLPVTSALVETIDGRERAIARAKYYVPGSVLRVEMDTTQAIAAGVGREVDVLFDNSPVFTLGDGAAAAGVRSVGWFNESPLRSGWAWGQKYLTNGVEFVEASIGRGRLYLFGPEVTFRGQPHGTFKLLFNGIYLGPAELSKVQ